MAARMLTDTKLKNLKPQARLYKVADRDGLYVAVLPSGNVSFRFDYRINGRRETLTIGKYGNDGISLAAAREALSEAKRLLNQGISPAAQKRDSKHKIRDADTFGIFCTKYMEEAEFAPRTREMKERIISGDILPVLGNKLMTEITVVTVRALCDKVKERGGRATAVRIRDIISGVYGWAIDRGHNFHNPGRDIKSSSIATFKPRERALRPEEIKLFFNTLDDVATLPTIKMAIKLALLNLSRKDELRLAQWKELNLDKQQWEIPAERTKARRPHNVYLSDQATRLFESLRMCSGSSEFVLPGRHSQKKSISNSALNNAMDKAIDLANERGHKLEHFSVHDMRRTASTILHESGYPSDWIEKCLAHSQQDVRAVYNKAEYSQQRRYMLQQWADMVDGWISGELTGLVPFSPVRYEKWLEGK